MPAPHFMMFPSQCEKRIPLKEIKEPEPIIHGGGGYFEDEGKKYMKNEDMEQEEEEEDIDYDVCTGDYEDCYEHRTAQV